MISSISDSHVQLFNTNRKVTVDGKTFRNIEAKNQHKYMQDGQIHKVNYLDTDNAHYSIFSHNNQIDQITKSYDNPKPMKFNGKTYNITFSLKTQNGTVYEQINPKHYGVTQIQVDNKGNVISINESLEDKISNGVKRVISKIGRSIKKL